MGAVNSSEAESADELHQEPEAAPFHPSSSPLSPQLSLTRGTSYLGPLLRVSDPYNILSPSSSSPRLHLSSRLQSMSNADSPHRSPSALRVAGDHICTEIHFIRHAESAMNARPELIGGRNPSAALTSLGKRQARALGAHLRSVGMEFDAVYSSPLERAMQTAYTVCQELDIPRETVEMAEAVQEQSQGQWEGRSRSEIYTPAVVPIVNSTQPDFRPPGGESQRQVEFRMIEFLNNVVIPRASQKARLQRGSREHLQKIQQAPTLDMEISLAMDGVEPEPVSESSGRGVLGHQSASSVSWASDEDVYTVAVISHSMAIKCLLRGLTGCDAGFTRRWCIENSSVTVVRHSSRRGWEIQRVNDTSHLRLL